MPGIDDAFSGNYSYGDDRGFSCESSRLLQILRDLPPIQPCCSSSSSSVETSVVKGKKKTAKKNNIDTTPLFRFPKMDTKSSYTDSNRPIDGGKSIHRLSDYTNAYASSRSNIDLGSSFSIPYGSTVGFSAPIDSVHDTIEYVKLFDRY